tara:strand:+ start:279 stop:437 length:159 start_codon:yes stop_codon:yes gene_type:complete
MNEEWQKFIEEVYEIAFGDSAFDRGFDAEEVLEELRKFSDNALKWEEHIGEQ